MRKNIIKFISIFIVIFSIFSLGVVFAKENTKLEITQAEYSEEYKEWLNLSDEEKKNTLEPRKYDIVTTKDNRKYLKSINNVFKVQRLLRATLSSSYDLREIIPENSIVRNQQDTDTCWAFAALGTLETNLALADKNDSKEAITYDFSEKHLNYATTRSSFLNGEINEYGYTRELADGGNMYMAIQYMANGLGAIDESDLPFQNSEEDIDISEIQNKEVTATLYDTVELPTTATADRTEIIEQMKQHISNYGGIYAEIHGATIIGEGYNNATGAIYCTDSTSQPMNHTVVVVGWDDNYDKSNFKDEPSSNGAWIVKNSWGETYSEELSTAKATFFTSNQNYCIEKGWNSAEDITDEDILNEYKKECGENKVEIQNGEIVVTIGDNGYMYVSYEDCNIYSYLIGIEKATASKDYEKVYQHDTLGANGNIEVGGDSTIVIANVFNRDTTQTELLDKVSIFTFQGYTCKVLVNPNGTSKDISELQEVALKEGESETIEPGYHTLEFAEPIELTGDSFVVAVQITNESELKQIALEIPVEGTLWEDAVVNGGEGFCATYEGMQVGEWTDLATLEGNLGGNATIKAYTTTAEEDIPVQQPEEPTEEQPEEQEPVEITLANFENAKSEITEAKMYFESTNLETSTGDVTIKVTGITNVDGNNTYYYYISGTQGDDNITNWKETEIVEESDGTYSIALNMTIEEFMEYPNLDESDNLYVYIREVAQTEQESEEQIITLNTTKLSDIEIYVDGTYIGGIEEFLIYALVNSLPNIDLGGENNSGAITQNRDNTTATGTLPYTGGTLLTIGAIIILIAFGIFAFYRYKHIDK